MRSAAQSAGQEAVGVAGTMPGTDGFTMACFEAAKVPAGTQLYAAPVNGGERCPACGGNDGSAPCAFPEGGQPRCLRDVRLGRAADAQQVGGIDAIDRPCIDAAGWVQPDDTEPNLAEITQILLAAWKKAEPKHSITLHPESYLATFVDMARAVRAALSSPAKACEYCDDTGDVHGIDGEWRGTCTCPAGVAISSPAKVGGDERERFEAYLRGIWTQGYGCAKDANGRYRDGNAQSLWECWSAALSADGGDRKDAERLDFLIEQQAWVQWEGRDGTIRQSQVWTQDHDENYHILSGDSRYFNTPREAIDAAIATKAKGE